MANSELQGDDNIPPEKINETTIGDTPPTNPILGYIWIDTSDSGAVRKIYNGTDWIATEEEALLSAWAYA